MRSEWRRHIGIARRLATGTVAATVSIGGLVGSAIVSDTGHAPVGGKDHVPVGEDDSGNRSVDHRAGHPSRPKRTNAARARSYVRPTRKTARISEGWGVPGSWAAGHHTGVDLAVPSGTTLRSVGPGKVILAGEAGAYGEAVIIHMKDGKYTLFAHLSKISVRVGQWVKARKVLGESGDTGRSTGPHLHFEVRLHRGYGSDINPVTYLARRGVRIS